MTEDQIREQLRDSTCLVTGGAGFIGSNLVRYLLDCGASVVVVDNMVTGKPEHLPEHGRLTLVQQDVCAPDALAAAPDCQYAFHLAAQVGNVKSLEKTLDDAQTNILGTIQLLRAFRGTAVRKVVYSSSSAIFGEAVFLPIDERHPQAPESFYALSKQTGEQYALLARTHWNVPAVCLRYFNVYGLPAEDNEYTGVISIFMRMLESGNEMTIYGDGLQSRDFVYVKDVVQALARAAVIAPPGEVYNIGTSRATTVNDLARTLSQIAEVEPRIHYRDARMGEVRHSVADIAKARAELHYEPRYSLQAGLREMWPAARHGKTHA